MRPGEKLNAVDTEMEDAYLTETELESSPITEDSKSPVKETDLHAGMTFGALSLSEHALAREMNCHDIPIITQTSAALASSCPPTEIDSSLSPSTSCHRTELYPSSPSAEGAGRVPDTSESRGPDRGRTRALQLL